MSDFLIVGGGINGLLLARELALADAKVSLVDKGAIGSEASWAGGGIVSPLYPWRYQTAVTALASWAQAFYPGLVSELIDETGIDPELNQSGLLMMAADDQAEALAWAATNQRCMEEVDETFLYSQEPALAAGFDSGLWMPEVANIRNPRLLQALLSSLSKMKNVSLLPNNEMLGVKTNGQRVEEVDFLTASGPVARKAERVIITAGAWSANILSSLGIELELEPVKGQMLLYKLPQPPLSSIVLAAGRYLIPRRDGHVLVGSTLEFTGFDKSVSHAAQQSLMTSAQSLLPMLRDHKPIAQWAGLRPGTKNGVPYIGKLGSFENLFINAGQFRNGLVLAPASARLLADELLGRPPILDPQPYSASLV